jgi:hypothetical protein
VTAPSRLVIAVGGGIVLGALGNVALVAAVAAAVEPAVVVHSPGRLLRQTDALETGIVAGVVGGVTWWAVRLAARRGARHGG